MRVMLVMPWTFFQPIEPFAILIFFVFVLRFLVYVVLLEPLGFSWLQRVYQRIA